MNSRTVVLVTDVLKPLLLVTHVAAANTLHVRVTDMKTDQSLQAERKWVHKAANQLLMCRAIKAWKQFQEQQQHMRSAVNTADRHFETTLMTHALHAWRNASVHVSSSEHDCAAVATDTSRAQELPPMAGSGGAGRHTGTFARPRSAGAGPKVGRCANVVVGHVRQAAGSKKRSQSTPRSTGSRQQQYVSCRWYSSTNLINVQ